MENAAGLQRRLNESVENFWGGWKGGLACTHPNFVGMAYAIQGRIKRKFDVEVFPSGFKKQELVVTTEEQYPQDIKLTFMKEKADMLERFQEGEVVVVNFDLRGREYQGKYYVDLSGWRIQPASEAGAAVGGMSGGASAGGSMMGGGRHARGWGAGWWRWLCPGRSFGRGAAGCGGRTGARGRRR